jgi:hypothetical protein
VLAAGVQPWLDRSILLDLALAAVAALAGIAAFMRAGPADMLHLLYGAVLLVVIAGGRYLGRRPGRSQAGWVAVSSLVALGVIVRLAMTG